VLIWTTLLIRVFYFSVKSNAYYEELSSRNSIKTELVYPARGIIFDRNKSPLAINKLGFAISITPHLSKKKNIAVLDQKIAILCQFFPTLNFEKIKALYMREDSAYNHENIRVVDFMPYEQILPFFTVLSLDEHIEIESTTMREYPEKDIAGHIIGYVARISKDDAVKQNIVSPNGYIGKDGLEKFYNGVLQGEPGSKTYKVNAVNEIVEQVDSKEPSMHHDLISSIDIRVQRLISELYAGRSGAIVVMDLSDGSIVAAGSFPEYDINSFVRGLGAEEWNAMVADLNHPLSNRLTKGLYPPGSVVKPGAALALQRAGVDPKDTVNDEGFIEFGGRRFRDWKKEGHGTVDMRKSIKESCDTYYYKMSLRVGISIISKALYELGLGRKTGVDLPGESAGIMPSPEWKKKRYNKQWFAGETLNTVIGQGSTLVTPLQVAKFTAALATGKEITPKFAMSVGGKSVESNITELIKPSEMNRLLPIQEGMYQVCSTQGGTAFGSLGSLPIKVAGKTGTAQVSSIGQSEVNRMKEEQLDYYKRSHAWLTTYAPYENPRFVVTALVEHGGHGGSEAGPMVAAVYRKLIELGYIKPGGDSPAQ
jgi:penicillin-binding protein 2